MKIPDPVSKLKKEKAINWQEINRQLEKNRQALEQGFKPCPKERRRIFKERARALAKEQKRQEADSEVITLVEFMISRERYGIELYHVREVYPLNDLTPLPGVPSFVSGIINFRGKVISVIDLRKFFDLPEKGLTNLARVIILHNEEMEFGLLADEILGVKSISPATLQATLPTLTKVRSEYLKGVSCNGLVVLDGAKLFADKKLIIHEKVGV